MAALQTLAGDVTRYAYAHDGIRLSQTRDATGANPVTTHYLIDSNQPYPQVIEEVEQHGSGALSVKALYAVGDDRIRRYTPAVAGGGGNPGVPAGLRYYHADGLGSARLLTDEVGAVTDRTTFEAFGELDTATSIQTSDNAFLYTGEQLDPNSGFVYLRARYMSPADGRFTQIDPFAGYQSEPLSLHKYTYGSGNPANNTDPSGRETLVGLGIANNAGMNLVLLATAYATSCALEYGITSTFGAPTTPTPTFGCRNNKKTYFHYTNAPAGSFVRGLWAGSAATTISGLDNVSASAQLGVPLPITLEYPVTIDPRVTRVTPVSIVPDAGRFPGGGTQVFFPAGTPPGSVGPPKSVRQVSR